MSTMVGTHLVLMDIQFGIVATSYSEVPKRGYIYIIDRIVAASLFLSQIPTPPHHPPLLPFRSRSICSSCPILGAG